MWLSVVRDVAIIVLAIESLVIGGLFLFLLFQLWRLSKLFEKEIKPLLESANETMSTMRGTTAFVSENVISPVVRVHSLMAGVSGGVKALLKSRSFRPRQRESLAGLAAEDETPASDIKVS